MGTWGTGITNDDTVLDVLGDITDWLKAGETVESASIKAEKKYAELRDDPDEGPLLWLAIAQAQWKYGTVEPRVLRQVRDDIKNGRGLERWEEDPRGLVKRQATLAKFLATIESPNPRPSAKPKLVIRKPPFRQGDCLSVTLPDGLFTAALVLKENHRLAEYGSNLIAGLDYLEQTPPDIRVFRRAKVLVWAYRSVPAHVRFRLGRPRAYASRERTTRDICWYTAPIPRAEVKRFTVIGNMGEVRIRPPKHDSYTSWANVGKLAYLRHQKKQKHKV